MDAGVLGAITGQDIHLPIPALDGGAVGDADAIKIVDLVAEAVADEGHPIIAYRRGRGCSLREALIREAQLLNSGRAALIREAQLLNSGCAEHRDGVLGRLGTNTGHF